MANLRSFFRRNVSSVSVIRILAAGGEEMIGEVMDINQKGFRLSSAKKFNPGDMLNGLIEFTPDGTIPQHIQVKAQCVWSEGKERGFSIKEVPMSAEDALDKLIDMAAARG
jgi:hypothetical protein